MQLLIDVNTSWAQEYLCEQIDCSNEFTTQETPFPVYMNVTSLCFKKILR